MVSVLAIQSSIQDYQFRLTAVSKDLQRLQEAYGVLSAVDTSLDYVLNDYDSTKSRYHLAGHPYLDMSDTEEETIKSLESYFEAKKSEVLSELNQRISICQMNQLAYSKTLNRLQSSLLQAQAAARKEG